MSVGQEYEEEKKVHWRGEKKKRNRTFLKRNPKKFLIQLAAQSGVSLGSIHTEMKLLKLQSCSG
jgi:hypothetical protein